MIDFRYHLTALVAVFLALGLGMLIGIAVIGPPAPEEQTAQLLALQQDFRDFREQNDTLRSETDDLQARLQRADLALHDVLPAYMGRRLAGRRIAVILTGELDDTGFLDDLSETLQTAGASVTSTTRLTDDWLPTDAEERRRVLATLSIYDQSLSDARVAAAVARAIVKGRAEALKEAANEARGLRLDGEYDRPVDEVLLISGTRSEERLNAAKAGLTPETGLLAGLRETAVRIVAAEPDGPEMYTTIPLWTRDAPATVDNIDMASGQFSAVYALAGRDGRFGLKRAAERPIPDLSTP